MKKALRKKLLISVTLIFTHLLAIFIATPLIIDWYLHSESTFKPQPEIDTVFTEGFSKTSFEKVTNGMTDEDVRELLGEPFSKQGIKVISPAPDNSGKITKKGEIFRVQPDAECWVYSKDGALKDADFSWFSYRVCFEDKKVYLTSVTEHGD